MNGKKLKICFTSDVHGYVYPTDYIDAGMRRMGLFTCAAGFEKDENTLVIDGGDMLQGSAFAGYCSSELKSPRVIAEIMNDCGYDYYTLGNHDFNFGQAYQKSYMDAMNARCVCENVETADGRKLYPAVVHRMPNGLRVGIVGIVTDYVNLWEKKENLEGLRITDPFTAAAQALEELRGQTDLTICVYHGGLEKEPETGRILSDSTENIGCRICEELDFDLLLTGHQHMSFAGGDLHGTYAVQPTCNATEYCCVEVTVCGEQKELRGWLVKAGEWDEANRKKSEKMWLWQEKYADTERAVQTWLDRPIGRLSRALLPEDKAQMALHGSGIADLQNRIQLYYSGAQISAVSLANELSGYQKTVTYREILSSAPYPNTLIVCRITGRQLRTVMERSAEYFALDEDGTLKVAESFLKPKVEHYYYDYYGGATYEIHPERPHGSRISNLCYQGRPVAEEEVFTMALNNYRYSGAGEYPTYRECPKLGEIQSDLAQLMVEYFQEFPYVDV